MSSSKADVGTNYFKAFYAASIYLNMEKQNQLAGVPAADKKKIVKCVVEFQYSYLTKPETAQLETYMNQWLSHKGEPPRLDDPRISIIIDKLTKIPIPTNGDFSALKKFCPNDVSLFNKYRQ